MNINKGMACIFTLMVLWNFGRSLLKGQWILVIVQYFMVGVLFSIALSVMECKVSMKNLRIIVAWLPGAWIPKIGKWLRGEK